MRFPSGEKLGEKARFIFAMLRTDATSRGSRAAAVEAAGFWGGAGGATAVAVGREGTDTLVGLSASTFVCSPEQAISALQTRVIKGLRIVPCLAGSSAALLPAARRP